MLDYATRLYRRYPHKPIHQVVIYLRKSESPKVRQNDYKQGKTSHQFEVIRLWEQPSEPLLKGEHLTYAISINTYNRQKLENLQLDHKEK